MTFSENNGKCRRYLQSKNKTTEGLRTFWKCFLEKTDKQFLLLKNDQAVTLRYKYHFCVEFLDGGKWKKMFKSYFLETWRS